MKYLLFVLPFLVSFAQAGFESTRPPSKPCSFESPADLRQLSQSCREVLDNLGQNQKKERKKRDPWQNYFKSVVHNPFGRNHEPPPPYVNILMGSRDQPSLRERSRITPFSVFSRKANDNSPLILPMEKWVVLDLPETGYRADTSETWNLSDPIDLVDTSPGLEDSHEEEKAGMGERKRTFHNFKSFSR